MENWNAKSKAHSVNGSTTVSKTASRGSNPLGPARKLQNLTKIIMRKFIYGFVAGLIALSVPVAFALGTLFSDVQEGDYFYDAVMSLSDKGIIHGYEDGKFKPSQNITRAEVAVIADNIIQYLQEGTVVEDEVVEEVVAADYFDTCNQHLGAYSTLSWFEPLEQAALEQELDLKLIADTCFFESEGMFVFILPDKNDPDFPPVYSYDVEANVLAEPILNADSFVGGFEFFGRDGSTVHFEGGYGEGGEDIDENGNPVIYACTISKEYSYDASTDEISVFEDNSECVEQPSE